MTIKGENTSNNRRGGGGNGMQYVVSSEPTSAEHIEDDIPFATAVPVEVATSIPTDQQQFQPQFVTTTPSNELMATPATTTTTSSNSNNSRQLNQTAATTAERPPPTGLPPGGRWVKMRHVGSNTWLSCGIVSAVFCFFFCFPCGVWAFCCPCDERLVYLYDDKLFDEDGGIIGSAKTRWYH